jgi:transposase-like protein
VNDPLQDRQVRRRLAVLRHAEEVTGNVAQTCRYYGISRQCYHTWLRRFEAEGGADGLRSVGADQRSVEVQVGVPGGPRSEQRVVRTRRRSGQNIDRLGRVAVGRRGADLVVRGPVGRLGCRRGTSATPSPTADSCSTRDDQAESDGARSPLILVNPPPGGIVVAESTALAWLSGSPTTLGWPVTTGAGGCCWPATPRTSAHR